MVETLKKLDKKFLILALIILLLPIMLIVFLAVIQGCEGGKNTYEEYEEKMILATEKYLKNKKIDLKNEGDLAIIELSKLTSEGYIKSSSKALDDDTCDGSITVRRNGSSIEANEGGYLNYIVSLKCDEYTTPTILSKLKNEVVTSGLGLYELENSYIFKGDKVNNYINFFGTEYRIMSIDKDGIMKLVKSEPEIISRIWDNKYNSEIDHSYGKTIYKDSAILSYLLNDYDNTKKFSKKSKEHLVAYDSCIGKRDSKNFEISHELDCSEILEKQIVSLLNVSDYALASADEDCNSILSKSCNNYNYLSSVASSTWTMNSSSNNTYEVFYITGGLIDVQNANSYNEYNIVIYVDGNEKYIEGNGTVTNPYVIE